jgi:tRNA A-37 threonylcarbamoyl transferase component Bud32
VILSGEVTPTEILNMANALALLLVRLHLLGFWWGDCSLSNTLFRRDANDYAAYLVDAETGEFQKSLSDGQREHDLELAHFNVAAELEDFRGYKSN